jgi:hypothetical protein
MAQEKLAWKAAQARNAQGIQQAGASDAVMIFSGRDCSPALSNCLR